MKWKHECLQVPETYRETQIAHHEITFLTNLFLYSIDYRPFDYGGRIHPFIYYFSTQFELGDLVCSVKWKKTPSVHTTNKTIIGMHNEIA